MELFPISGTATPHPDVERFTIVLPTLDLVGQFEAPSARVINSFEIRVACQGQSEGKRLSFVVLAHLVDIAPRLEVIFFDLPDNGWNVVLNHPSHQSEVKAGCRNNKDCNGADDTTEGVEVRTTFDVKVYLLPKHVEFEKVSVAFAARIWPLFRTHWHL